MNLSKDERLDLWIESSVFRRSRNKRFGVPAYSRYLNRALGALDHLDVPYEIHRLESLRWVIRCEGANLLVDTADELAHGICRMAYHVLTGKEWPWTDDSGDSNG